MEMETKYLDTGLGVTQSEHRSFVLSLETELSLFFQPLRTARDIQDTLKWNSFLHCWAWMGCVLAINGKHSGALLQYRWADALSLPVVQ